MLKYKTTFYLEIYDKQEKNLQKLFKNKAVTVAGDGRYV